MLKMAKSSTSNLSIVGQTPPRSPTRETLAAAIDRHAEAKREIENNERGQETCFHFRIEARAALDEANAALQKAKEDQAQHFKDVALGLTTLAPPSLKEAIAAVELWTDNLANMTATDEALTAERPALENRVSIRELYLSNAIKDVVKSDPAVDQLLTDFVELHRKFIDMKRIIQFLDSKNMIPDQHAHIFAEKPWPELQSVKAWEAAVAALAIDSDAMFPIHNQG